SGVLKYAFAELEESRGAIQPAKAIYESLIAENAGMTSLAHIQFIRFLRRTEGIEAARKYFLDARKLPGCTYHVYVAYATMAFCLDKDAKVAQSVFEAGLKRFMHEPGYILEYADFLCRLNDDRNVRALFERALSLLPPEESIEIMFSQVEQRRKEALSRTSEDALSALENTLYDVVSRYSYMDLWPCSTKELDYLSRHEWLAKNIANRGDKSVVLTSGATLGDIRVGSNKKSLPQSSKVVRPEISRMVIYDPRQMKGPDFSTTASGYTKEIDEILKRLSPQMMSFITNLPAIEGPSPDMDIVLSVLMQSTLPVGDKPGSQVPGPATSDLSGPGKSGLNQNGSVHRPPRDGQSTKRKNSERGRAQEEDDTSTTVQSRAMPRDIFRLRQIQRSRGLGPSQSGSAALSSGSVFSGDQSASSG
uniref:Suppressor of forked domain-containing protein n=1 Tax=Oryza glaberrima TaxID=4538 RepID=I1R8C2_ORYGL